MMKLKKIKPLKGVSGWKSVNIDDAQVSGDFDGLIGIEELTDYNQESIILKPKKRKWVVDNEDVEDITPKKKSIRKIKTKKKVQKIKRIDGVCNKASNPQLSVSDLVAWDFVPLDESVRKALADQGFVKPTQIQELTLPAAIFGRRDILGAAETGSGKTLAFGLPIIHGILKIKAKDQEELKSNHNALFAVVFTPTRELAVQVKNHIEAAAKYTGIQVVNVFGGMSQEKQERLLKRCPEIVVATPGRFWQLYNSGNPHLAKLESIRFLAIDETDRMVEKGHFEELLGLLERLRMDPEKAKKRQNFVFSATLTLVHDIPHHLMTRKKLDPRKGRKIHKLTSQQKLSQFMQLVGMTNYKVVDVTRETGTSGTLTETRIRCENSEKDFYAYYFVAKYPGRTLAFCNSIGCAKRLANLLVMLKKRAWPLHGNMRQSQRLLNLERFRTTEDCVLVATDVAARGLDIPNVDHVLHYQAPRTAESYVHRSGRTARAFRVGLSVVLVEYSEASHFAKLLRTLKRPDCLPDFPIDSDFLSLTHKRVDCARQLDGLKIQIEKSAAADGWLQKAITEMDIIVDDDDKLVQKSKKNAPLKKEADMCKKRLDALFADPCIPKKLLTKYPTKDMEDLMNSNKPQTAIEALAAAKIAKKC